VAGFESYIILYIEGNVFSKKKKVLLNECWDESRIFIGQQYRVCCNLFVHGSDFERVSFSPPKKVVFAIAPGTFLPSLNLSLLRKRKAFYLRMFATHFTYTHVREAKLN
jgi:hypothetical protein